MVARTEQRGNGDPADVRSDRRGMAILKKTPAQNAERAFGERKTVVWDPQKVNSFWKGVMRKTADAVANLVAKTPEPTAAPVPEPAQ